MRCEKCGEEIVEGHPCYQVRSGYIAQDTFFAEEEEAYFCEGCGLERGNFSSGSSKDTL